ncbi:alpha-L-rhamnosidase N-terminal domain-containing protein [Reichenbachiella carrageenanivorans]|uniref:Alpha-L-rhamnosidase N-terminal domain-containing protein n=1 Tax=Reichenbachiella carrageenanivorans TaxID=2979869 RepID=A0ABY6D158_9BACT|nr:alpha-L-rhamnosidase C-terminal domain-containing protein [Reichenbachiella carrageenanivorans]UXX79897.1 alpha-L-rhamnosidase N-terminal domain-containing protein [Reichenbachiella carrageenanivorans]
MNTDFKKVLLLIGLSIWTVVLFAQESQVTINHQGKDFNMLKHAWNAQWITHPSASTMDYGVFNFRRTFDLKEAPKSFVVHLSADNRYKLYVNGTYVGRGPAIGDIAHWRYETHDLAPYLQAGTNTIAVEVINFGEFRHAKQQTFQTALILQGDTHNPVSIDTAKDSEWKVIKNNAYSTIPFVSDSVGGYYAAGPGDQVDGTLYPWGWKSPTYNDSQWQKPRLAMVEFAVGRGFLFGSTWYLVPRQIPFLSDTVTRFKKVAQANGINVSKNFVSGNEAITIPANAKVSILLDHEIHTIGYPILTVSQGKNTVIKTTYAEALFYKTSHEFSAHGGWKKGPRNDLEDQEIRGYYDIFKTDGGAQRSFQPQAMRTFRFVSLDITTADEPLVIEDYHNIYSVYPFEEKATFQSSDPSLNAIWDAAWLTLQNSSTDQFEDPYYEQLQYIGDTRIESLVSIFVSGDDRLMRKAIQQFDDSRMPNGLTQSRYPSYINQVIPTYSLLWIGMLHDYMSYRNDPEFIRNFLPGIKSVLGWFENKVDDTGMLANLAWWNFTDWSEGFQNGIPVGADDGHSANVSLQYALALQKAAEVFELLDETAQAQNYRKQAAAIIQATVQNCYDEDKKLIAERPEKDVFSQHTNVFAILADAVAPADQPALLAQLLSEKDLIQSSIYFKFYLTRAMQKAGAANLYTASLAPWKDMLDRGMTTFGETDVNPRSECHGWSASPCFDFIHTIAGIQSAAPGFQKVLIAPSFGDLTEVEASFPHPNGTLAVHFSKNKKGKVSGTITLPTGITGDFKWNNQFIKLKSGVNHL